MTLVVLVHAVIAVICLCAGDRIGRRALLLGVLGPAASLALVMWWAWRGQGVMAEYWEWAPTIGLGIGFRLDGMSALMVVLIGGVGVLVFAYSEQYFGDRPGLSRFVGYLVVFAGSMFGLVTADNMLLLFVFWELTSVMSYLLIGFDHESAAARASALQALLVTAVGGLAMLAGIVLMAQAAGTYSLWELLADPPTGALAESGLALIVVGALAKSAQFPVHFWLPGAMSAPTPVSAYLHSATMVKAGIYLIARFAPVYAGVVVWWRPWLVAVGLVTMVVGGWRALSQSDVKLLLAYGTVSQLGFIVVLVSLGTPSATFAGLAMILAHGVFKAALFMVAGIVDHQAHTRDLRRLSGLGRRMPATLVVAAVAVASMAGVPPLLGFISKEAALGALVGEASWWTSGIVVVGSVLTVAYGLRFLWGTFATKPQKLKDEVDAADVTPPGTGFLIPAALLAAVTIAAGVMPRLVGGIVEAAAVAVDPGAGGHRLALWHGLGTPLLLSALALAGGWVLWRRPLVRLGAWTGRLPSGTRIYAEVLAGINRVADRTTSVLQNGSLPVYLAVILSVAVLAPGIVAVASWREMPSLVLAESPVQAVTALAVIGATLGTVLARKRLGAVLFLGAVGYGVAVLFVVQGAPDLALTQLLIETLALGLFAFVLSRLPSRFEIHKSRIRHVTRVAVSVAGGLAAMSLSLWAVSGRVAPSLAPEFLTQAELQGGGRNVVNVILTDIRALDTLGEITVLAVAAMGAIALIRARLPVDESTLDTGRATGQDHGGSGL